MVRAFSMPKNWTKATRRGRQVDSRMFSRAGRPACSNRGDKRPLTLWGRAARALPAYNYSVAYSRGSGGFRVGRCRLVRFQLGQLALEVYGQGLKYTQLLVVTVESCLR